MAHVVAPLRHLGAPYTGPGTELAGANLSDHRIAAGAVPDGYVFMANDAATNKADWGNDGKALINAPLRAVLIADSAPISNTAAVTPFNKTLTLLAGSANVQGARLRVAASGKYSSKASAPGVLQFMYHFAGAMVAYSFSDLLGAQTNQGWSFWAEFIVRTTGSSGTVQPHGGYAGIYQGDENILKAAGRAVGDASVIVPFTMNLTIDRTIATSVQFSVADVANTITMTAMSLDVALPGVVVT